MDNTSNKDISLIININNFSVEAAIFERENKNFLQVLETENLVKNDINSISELEKKLERILRKIVEKAAALKKRFEFCLVVCSSPWFIAQTHFVKIKKEQPFVFNNAELDKILKDENSTFIKKLKDGSDLKFIEVEIMKVLLNGYEIKNPFGKKSKSAELYLYLSAVKNSFFEFINHLIGFNLGLSGDSLLIKTRPSLLFLGLKDVLNFKERAVLIDIGEDISEIILIKNNYIEEVISFNKGRNFFIRRLMSAFNFSFDEAESVFSGHQKNHLENRFKQNIDAILKDSQKDWRNSFLGALKELSADHFLPNNLFFFSAKPASKEFFISASEERNENGFLFRPSDVETKDLKSFVSTRDSFFYVQEISFKQISSYFKTAETYLKNYSPFLIIGIIFLNKFLNNHAKS